ncbi:MAG TPA: two-component regulator propeller domain-containing protein [Ignavibacteriales bacterium]|nr:two-component regulator propeller domain-containing protein [Ignavibacteriales bacterium]
MKKLCLFVLILVSSYSFCQDKQWINYNTKNSKLPSNKINAIAVDSFGVKWVSADKGLVKIDGENWTIYDKSNSAVTCPYPGQIAIEGKDTLWIATYCAGLIRFDGTNWKVYTHSNSPLPSNGWINSVAIDNQGNKWAATASNGVAKFDGKNWTIYNKDNTPLPSNFVNYVAINPMGWKIFGTDNGLAMFADTAWYVFNKDNSPLPGNNVLAISFDKKGIMWVGTNGQGLVAHAGTSCTIFNTFNSDLKSNFIQAIYIDTMDQKWIGTQTGGLYKIKDSLWTVMDTLSSGIASDSISAIAPDTGRALWIGTSNKGISVYTPPVSDVNDARSPGRIHSHSLSQNYPNPFNPSTKINYSIPKEEFVSLKIFNILGSEVATMVNEVKKAGSHSVEFNASKIPSGMYIYSIQAGEFRASKKLILIK